MLCGECPVGWARFADFSACEACWTGTAGWQLSFAILFELSKIAGLNFLLASLAAMDSANANLPLHTCMIRVLTQWATACALITHFNMEVMETPFAQSSSGSADECAGQTAQLLESNSSGRESMDFSRDSDVFANVRLQWPPAATHALAVMFDIAAAVPAFTSVKFSAQCRAFEMFGTLEAQRLAPAMYYISLPILTVFATLVVCAIAVYAGVPLARRFGVHLNKVAKDKHKKRKEIEALFGPWMKSFPASEVPRDLPRFHDLNGFLTFVDSHESFVKELCRIKSIADPQLQTLLADLEVSLETFQSLPQTFLFAEFSKEELKTVSCLHSRFVDNLGGYGPRCRRHVFGRKQSPGTPPFPH